MGRKKPGKPRRQRIPRQYTLRELQPPGEAYDEWYDVRPGMDASNINDPRLGAEALDLMRRMARLGAAYKRSVPKAAIYLDTVLDSGNLGILQADGSVTVVPMEEMSRGGQGPDDVRESIHALHAVGAFLVVPDAEHDVPLIRFVSKPPKEPGEPWRFIGDPGALAASTCVPTEIWDELDADVAGAVLFMRTCRSQLRHPDPAEFGRHNGINGTEHARELFAAASASGFVDYKGCEACPTGHLCTRSED